MLSIDGIITKLSLKPHRTEGGYFAEIYRSSECIGEGDLPQRYSGKRTFSTAIYYLITKESFSKMHRLQSDEVFHFYMGDPVEMLQIKPDGVGEIVIIGKDLMNNEKPQVVVARNMWQGARLCEGGKYALLGTTVAPSFEFIDYEDGDRDTLIKLCPAYEENIKRLTP